MNFEDFTKLVISLYMTSNNYAIEFNICDDDGGGTFKINSIHEFGEFLENSISEWRMKRNEYCIQILSIELMEV